MIIFLFATLKQKQPYLIFLVLRNGWELHDLLEQFVESSQLISSCMLCGTQLCMEYITHPVSSDIVYRHCSKRTKYNINYYFWYYFRCTNFSIHIHAYAGIFTHILQYSGIVRHNQALFKHIQNPDILRIKAMLTAIAYLEPWCTQSSEQYSELWYIQDIGIYRTVVYSEPMKPFKKVM